jgi:hypothetical protein
MQQHYCALGIQRAESIDGVPTLQFLQVIAGNSTNDATNLPVSPLPYFEQYRKRGPTHAEVDRSEASRSPIIQQ